MKILYLLILIFNVNAFTFSFSDDPEDFFKVKCNPTSPKANKKDVYSIGKDKLPKKNGSEYVYSARDVADEVFKIVFAQGGNLSSAFGKCNYALVKVGNGSTKPCEKYLSTLQYNDGLQSNLRNNDKYKSPEKPDGLYEICDGDFVSHRYTSKDELFDDLREIFDDYTNYMQERIFYKDGVRVWDEDYFTYGLYRDGQKLLYKGPGEINEINNLRTRRNYKDGELHGAYEKYFPNGQLLYKLNYVDGEIEDGRYPIYSPNGASTDLVFKDGSIHEGLYRKLIDFDGFYGFASKFTIPFKDGYRLDGSYKESWMYELSDGTGFEKKTFKTYSIKDGYFHGEKTEWFYENNGSTTRPYKRVINYKDGYKDGWDRSWYSNGNKHSDQTYIDGVKFGFSSNYSSNGIVNEYKRECYINDVPMKGNSNGVKWGDKRYKCLDPDKNDGYIMQPLN